eukprot:scaffold70597_cov40-Attheya_sp.AAC.1
MIDAVGPNRWIVLWSDTVERSEHPSNALQLKAEGGYSRTRGTMAPASRTAGFGHAPDVDPLPVVLAPPPVVPPPADADVALKGDIDQIDPRDFEFENIDDRFTNKELLFAYDGDLALEMEKDREVADKMISATNEKKVLEDVMELEVLDKKEYAKIGIRGFKFGGKEDDRGDEGDNSTDDSSSDEEERS